MEAVPRDQCTTPYACWHGIQRGPSPPSNGAAVFRAAGCPRGGGADRRSGATRPSAGWTQGQSFVVVTEPAGRETIAGLAGEQHYVDAGFDRWISGAPVHIVVCVSEAAYRRRYSENDKYDSADVDAQEWPVPFWWVDAGASMQNILLAAVDEGLAAGFLGIQSIGELTTFLGIPEDVSPIGVVTLGHPLPDRKSGSLKRGRRTDDVHWEGW